MLTQNTSWRNVERAIGNLRAEGRLSYPALSGTSRPELERLIRPAGTFRVKAERLRHLLDWMARECGGELSRLRERPWNEVRASLLEVHGVGPETADSILLYALGQPVFVIDAYARRVLSRHGLLVAAASYAEAQRLFHDHVTPEAARYNEYHALIVRLGKEHCRARAFCDGCPLDALWPASPAPRPVQEKKK